MIRIGRKRHTQITDRNEAWWAAWKLAHTSTCMYESFGRDVDRETALSAIYGWSFPDEQTLRWRLKLAQDEHDARQA